MSRLDSLVDNKIVQNLCVWLFLFLILLSTIQAENRALTSLFAILLLAPAVYINNLIILPFLRSKTIVFALLFLANIILFTVISVWIIHLAIDQDLQFRMFVNFFGIMILAMVSASAIKLARDGFTRRQQEKEAKLKLLKAQLNPHFLFNTLNNLYGLSVVKSDKLPDLMLKLSDLLRYSLYNTEDTVVPLEKEITYLENYISLEKIRLDDQTHIDFVKSGDLVSKKIAPMLLIVFVENAFKHIGTLEDGTSKVLISLKESNDRITFVCTNTTEKINAQDHNLEKERSGIGLQNAKKRLNLIYPDQHQLTITKKETNYYCVELIVDL